MSGRGGLAWLEALGPQTIRPGLARTRALLLALGSPERSFRSILIGGTNGKGSTAATCAAILHAAGIRTGLTSSPHLLAVNERIRLLEKDVDDRRLDEALALVAAVSGTGHRAPTYFEALTVAAFELFRRAQVEVAVVEVGIGGLLDATNVLDPALSVVTNVGADHLETLGPTLADVARNKAGIFRAARPALTSAGGPELAVLREEAARIGARLTEVPGTADYDGTSPLRGRHQRANLALASAAARLVAPLSEETVRRGVAATRWPGRLDERTLPGGRRLVLDGAHNPDGARALAAWLDGEGLSGSCDLLFGGLADKDLAGMLALLSPRARRIVLTAPASPRAEDPARLAALLPGRDVRKAPDAASALDVLMRDGGAVPIIAAGSLVLVGDVLREALRLSSAPGARLS